MVNALRVLKWCDGSMNLGLSDGVRKGYLEKAGIWGGDIQEKRLASLPCLYY